MAQKNIYLDYAAATPLDSDVLGAMMPLLTDSYYNPSALYLGARDVRQTISDSRQKVARILGARPAEITFTAGGTEANNLAINGVMQNFKQANLVVSTIEHDSVLAPAEQYQCRKAAVDSRGIIDLDLLAELIDDQTVLVSVMYANNEIGTVQPLSQVGKLVQEIRKQRKQTGNTLPIYFHTDACQATNYLDLHVDKRLIDLMTLNGGKIYGPKQSGALFVRTGVKLTAQILGGGQESGLRSGTENPASIVGFTQALEKAVALAEPELLRLKTIQLSAMTQLLQKIPNLLINGCIKADSFNGSMTAQKLATHSILNRLPNNIHITIHGADNERLIMELDERGIQVSAGSACSASSKEASHVLRSISMSDELARSSIRLTMGRETSENDMTRVIGVLSNLVR